jgi:hypothetical protein
VGVTRRLNFTFYTKYTSLHFINNDPGTSKSSSSLGVILFIMEVKAERWQLNISIVGSTAVGER